MEQPNLVYIHSLSGGDKTFEAKIIGIIKSEFPEEKKIYNLNLAKSNYQKAAENVHKLKHKISILGLTNGYTIAEAFENNLRKNSIALSNEFQEILEVISTYLNEL